MRIPKARRPPPGLSSSRANTVTPAPISGEVTITREVFDTKGALSANNLVWSRMQAAYLKVAEQRAAAALAAATLTAVPAVGVNTALVDGLSGALFSLAMGEMTQDLTTLLLGTALSAPLEAARSTAGERLVSLIAEQPPRMSLASVREPWRVRWPRPT
ncbi:hypothetical protein [Kribbella sp. NPDC051718]|uniref:hypothetical protein n=1 Tax=Kribbella sp. NPDC051718 TaxID=3155168 RepID=UPI00343022A0